MHTPGYNSGGARVPPTPLVTVRQGHNQHEQEQPTDMFVACFEAALDDELKAQAISSGLRACFERISSPYSFIRNEGLREALQRLCDLSLEAAEEAAYMADKTPAARATSSPSLPASPTPHLPYDAIRSSVMPRGVAESQGAGKHRGKEGVSTCQSPSWERAQRALRGAHYTSSVFHRILVAQVDERTRYQPGGPVKLELSEDAAIMWNTLNHAKRANPPQLPPEQHQGQKTLTTTLTEVTYQEQELALRLLQGLSLVVYDQRRVIAEGPLIPFLVEVWQCCLQHMEALFSFRRRRRQASSEKTHGASASVPVPITTTTNTTTNTTTADTLPFEEGPVQLESGLENVIIASIDAVEAACHYNPLALTRLVQQGGVRALLNLGLCPYAPYDIRCCVFDTVSVLMQEVAPFRRAVTGGVRNASPSGGVKDNDEDELSKVMVSQAMAGGASTRAAPPAYLMDRASASKFDSAVRDWFSQQGLSQVVSVVLGLRDVRGKPLTTGGMPKAEIARIVQRNNQMREKRLQALLQAVDGKTAAL